VPRDGSALVEREPAVVDEGSPNEPIALSKVLRWGLGTTRLLAFAYGPIEIEAAVLGFAAIALLVWFWTAFDSR
jgi:hypothetical protein